MNRNLVLAVLNGFVGILLYLLVSWKLISWLMEVGLKWPSVVQILATIIVLLIAFVPLIFGTAGMTGYVQRHIAQKEQLAKGV
mgnify:CR=1 FL=1